MKNVKLVVSNKGYVPLQVVIVEFGKNISLPDSEFNTIGSYYALQEESHLLKTELTQFMIGYFCPFGDLFLYQKQLSLNQLDGYRNILPDPCKKNIQFIYCILSKNTNSVFRTAGVCTNLGD